MKKIVIFALIFAALLPISFAAIINTTHGGTSNPSLTVSDYNATCAKLYDGSNANSCANTSMWITHDSDGTATVTTGQHHVNFTVQTGGGGGGGENSVRFYTGRLATQIPEGYCVDFKIGIKGTWSGGSEIMVMWSPDTTSGTASVRLYHTGTDADNCGVGKSRKWMLATANCGADTVDTGVQMPVITDENSYQNITFCQNSTSINGVVYWNNSNPGSTNQGDNTGTNTGNLTFYGYTGGGTQAGDGVAIKDIFVYPQTGAPQAVISPNTAPPIITYYNLTSSSGGCEAWNTDKNTACSTSIVNPALQFNTDENAWCAIAGSSSSTSFNLNYTEMGSSKNCTGDYSGEGGTSHLCTLTSQDELVYDTSYLFVSCKDAAGNMNRSGTSTSGPLKVSVTGLEAAGRDSIGIGIQNALLSGYTNYTDQQIYARNLSNAQVKGTFDRAVKKDNKMWAFNRIGVSDSHVNMFNLTPVLYIMEYANMTSTNLTNMTQALIEATR